MWVEWYIKATTWTTKWLLKQRTSHGCLCCFFVVFWMKVLVFLPDSLSLHHGWVVCRAACLCLRHSPLFQASHPASRAWHRASPPSPSWPITTTRLYQQPSATVDKVRETDLFWIQTILLVKDQFLWDLSSAIYVFCRLAANEAADCSKIIPFWVNILFPKGLNKRDKVLKLFK